MKARDRGSAAVGIANPPVEDRIGIFEQESYERHNFDMRSDRVHHRALVIVSWSGIKGVEEP